MSRNGTAAHEPFADVPPHSEANERALLGGLIVNPAARDLCVPGLTPASFYVPGHRVIFASFEGLRAQGRPISADAIREDLASKDQLEDAGGADYLEDLSIASPHSSVDFFSADVVALERRRAMREQLWRGVKRAGNPRIPLAQVAAEAREALEIEIEEEEDSSAREWPSPMGNAALLGLAGDVVDMIAPTTEADPHAILGQFLVAFGSCVGRGPYTLVEDTPHRPNLFMALVGRSSKARKGTSWDRVRAVFERVDPEWTAKVRDGGLSTGEGVIWAIRDPVTKMEPVRKGGEVVDQREVVVDQGEADKRLLVVEPEFAQVFKAMKRDGNTLSPLIRSAWDGKRLAPMVRGQPYSATDPHVSIVAQITHEELVALLCNTDVSNGFANRFLFVAARRARLLPDGGRVDERDMRLVADHLDGSLDFARRAGLVTRDPEAAEMWREVYPRLSADLPGRLGSILGRAEAQVLRLSVVYALLERSKLVQVPHLEAALAFWDYCQASAEFVFSDSRGNRLATRLLQALRQAGSQGLSRTAIRDTLGRKAGQVGEVDQALQSLLEAGQVRKAKVPTGGAPKVVWFATTPGEP